jgi:hypothetical protein
VCFRLPVIRVGDPVHRQRNKKVETHFPPFATCPFSLRCHRRLNNTNNAIISQYTLTIMKLSVSDELTFHAYIIQAAALASAEHFYSQVGGKRAATRLGKSARKRVRRSVEEIYHCLGPIE